MGRPGGRRHHRLCHLAAAAGWADAAVHPGGEHHEPGLCAVGPGGGRRLRHPGAEHWPARREPGQQARALPHPEGDRPPPLQQLQPRRHHGGGAGQGAAATDRRDHHHRGRAAHVGSGDCAVLPAVRHHQGQRLQQRQGEGEAVVRAQHARAARGGAPAQQEKVPVGQHHRSVSVGPALDRSSQSRGSLQGRDTTPCVETGWSGACSTRAAPAAQDCIAYGAPCRGHTGVGTRARGPLWRDHRCRPPLSPAQAPGSRQLWLLSSPWGFP